MENLKHITTIILTYWANAFKIVLEYTMKSWYNYNINMKWRI